MSVTGGYPTGQVGNGMVSAGQNWHPSVGREGPKITTLLPMTYPVTYAADDGDKGVNQRTPRVCAPAHYGTNVLKFVAHSRTVLKIAVRLGWLPGARYTNLRDVRRFDRVGFLDINWRDYCFRTHLQAVRQTRPLMTVARDLTDRRLLPRVLAEAVELSMWAEHVVVVPKSSRLTGDDISAIPRDFVVGYSVPTKYGSTTLSPTLFRRPVHLLGGRPDVQRQLANAMPVVSFDCNRFTLDAAFGDYFDGQMFRPHPVGGYRRCLSASVRNINQIWEDYDGSTSC